MGISARRVLVVGSVIGVNRSQTLIRYLASRGDFNVKAFTSTADTFLVKVARKLQIDSLYYIVQLFLFRPDVVVLLAMNSRNTAVLRLAQLVGSKTIVDFYTPRSSINSVDRKLDHGRLRALRGNLRSDHNRIRSANLTLFLTEHEKVLWTRISKLDETGNLSAVIPLVIPEPKYVRVPKAQLGDVYKICWWGKMSHLHGLDYILKELLLVHQTGREFLAEFFDDDEGRVAVFNKWVSSLPESFSSKIHVDSQLTMGQGLEEHIVTTCDLSIGPVGFTSLELDSVANKVVEAWALGVPLVTQKSLALPNRAEKASLILEDRNPMSLAKLVIRAIDASSSESVAGMVAEGRKIYESKFSEKSFYEGMDKVFRDLLT